MAPNKANQFLELVGRGQASGDIFPGLNFAGRRHEDMSHALAVGDQQIALQRDVVLLGPVHRGVAAGRGAVARHLPSEDHALQRAEVLGQFRYVGVRLSGDQIDRTMHAEEKEIQKERMEKCTILTFIFFSFYCILLYCPAVCGHFSPAP